MLKSTIPFANIRFFDDVPTVPALERRFSQFLRNLREQRDTTRRIEAKLEDGSAETLEVYASHLSTEDKLKIANRAMRYVDRLDAATGMQHLRTDDRKALHTLKDGATVSRVLTEHDADVLAAALHEEMPWMGPATEHIWHAMRQTVREERPGFQFAPLLLLGPPGIGKSHWARQLGKLLEVPTTVVDATGEPASFALIGSQRGWGSAGPGKIMETILKEKYANPIIVVDEIEKAGEVNSQNGLRFSLTEALLPLLERMTASTWQCPYYRVQFDLSWVGWVLTANSLHGLPEPLLSRCPPLELPPVLPTATNSSATSAPQELQIALQNTARLSRSLLIPLIWVGFRCSPEVM
jgi:hypothetical protein